MNLTNIEDDIRLFFSQKRSDKLFYKENIYRQIQNLEKLA